MRILHSVLPKGDYLREIGVAGNWQVWGFPTLIHTDNGKDFVGKMLCRAADEHNIHLTRRPIHDPHFGAHIERFFGTLR
jgi:putative transposase